VVFHADPTPGRVGIAYAARQFYAVLKTLLDATKQANRVYTNLMTCKIQLLEGASADW